MTRRSLNRPHRNKKGVLVNCSGKPIKRKYRVVRRKKVDPNHEAWMNLFEWLKGL